MKQTNYYWYGTVSSIQRTEVRNKIDTCPKCLSNHEDGG